MERQAEFSDLFRRQRRQQLLMPSNCTVFDDQFAWHERLQPGDHIVVYTDLVYHHGIYLGNRWVIHVVDHCPAIQQCPLKDFVRMAGRRDGTYGIVHHVVSDGVAEELHRKATVEFATFCLNHLSATEFRTYDEFTNNCESFVWFVFSGGTVKCSEEALRISQWILDQLKQKHEEFDPAQMAAMCFSRRLGSSVDGCWMM